MSSGPTDKTVQMSASDVEETRDLEIEVDGEDFDSDDLEGGVFESGDQDTVASGYDASMTAAHQVGLVAGSGPGFRTEQVTLLRSRLFSVAAFLSVA